MSDDEIKRTNRLPRRITLSQLDERNKIKLKSWINSCPHLKLLAAPDLLASGTAAFFSVNCIVCCSVSSAVACGTTYGCASGILIGKLQLTLFA